MDLRTPWFVALLVACGGAEPAPAPAPALEASLPIDATLPVDAALLYPHLRDPRPATVAPSPIVFDLARPAWTADTLGIATTEGTELTWDPPIQGTLSWDGPARLHFVPDAPLPHAVTFRATISAITTHEGVRRLPEPVSAELRTPGFALDRVALVEAAPGSDARLLDLHFTGPVSAADVLTRLRVGIEGGATLTTALAATPEPHLVRVAVRGPALRQDPSLVVRLAAGTPAADGGSTAPATELSLDLPHAGGGAVEVLQITLREGSGGFAIDVVCTDRASGEADRYWWDRESYASYSLSPRCQPDAASLATHIHLAPEVPFELVPSGGGFRLRADLPRGGVQVRLDAGLRTLDGGLLDRPVVSTLLVGPRRPTVRILAQGRYLPHDAWSALPIEHRNLDHVQLRLRHVPRRNLLFWLTGWDERADERTSDLVVDATIPLAAPLDEALTTWIPIADHLAHPDQGVYEVSLEGGGVTDLARVLVTDLDLVAKRSSPIGGRPTWDLWVTGIHDHRPVAAAEVSLVRPSGQVVDRGTTDSAGHARLTWPDDLDTTEPIALLASLGSDLTYLRFDDVRITPSEDEVQGVPWASASPYHAALWTERGVYRPGEAVHLAGILRGTDEVAPPAGLPVRVDVTDALGRPVRRSALATNEAGLLSLDLALQDAAPTGRWEAVAVVGDEVVGRRTFFVEAFVPERLKVDLRLPDGALLAGAPVPFDVAARWRFGGSAEGARVEARCTVTPGGSGPPAAGHLAFGPVVLEGEPAPGMEEGGSVDAVVDATGSATLNCPALRAISGPGTLTVEVAVFEGGSGRATRSTARAPVLPGPVLVGLDRGLTRVDAGRAFSLSGEVVDAAGKRTPSALSEVDVELLRIEDEWDWSTQGDGGESFRRWRRRVPDGTLRVPVTDGRFTVTATAGSDADAYLVRVRAGGVVTERVLEVEGRWGGWIGEGSADTPEPKAPGSVAIVVAEDTRVGARLPVSFDAPWPGRALVTVETDRLVEARWLDVRPGRVDHSVRVEAFAPNVYISVLLLKDPHAESAASFRPERAFGAASVRVVPEAQALDVRLTVPAEVRSESTLPVQVDVRGATGRTWVVVAAVDEGVLSLTNHLTPAPLRELFPQRTLGVETFETIGWSRARPQAMPRGRTGGDTGGPIGKVEAIRPVALWSGWVEVTGGTARVPLVLPPWRGALRVMAWAAGARQAGHAEATVIVKDPIVLLATLPRFLVQGDRAQIPVELTNLSGRRQEVEVSLVASSIALGGRAADSGVPVTLEGADRTTLTLEDGAARTVVFRVTATGAPGGAALEVRATAGTVSVRERSKLSIVSDAPHVRRSHRIELAPGDTSLAAALTGWTPTTERTTVWVTSNPYASALTHLADVVHYPYGCLEQTISATRPLLFVRDALPGVLPELGKADTVDTMVQAGVQRALTMRTPSGGFAYWPGDDAPVAWGTAYALHLLLDARELGHAVPAEAIDDATAWLAQWVDTREGSHADTLRESAYAHYVLARAGSPRKARAQVVLDRLVGTDAATEEARYLARAALWRAGDRRHEAALRVPAIPSAGPARWTVGYGSVLRARGLVLTIHGELFPKELGVSEALAQEVAASLSAVRSGAWTTQELAWGLSALGRRSQGAAQQATVTLLDGGRALEGEQVATGRPDLRWQVTRASERPELTLRTGTLDGRLYALLQSEGARADTPWTFPQQGLRLARSWRDAEGAPLDAAAVRLGELFYVVLELSNPGTSPVRELALVDRLPAGWEIENPRLGGAALPAWADPDTLWKAEHLEVRDDRVEVFGDLEAGETVRVIVGLRATTAGRFTLPPASVEAMYDPSVLARVPGADVTVRGAWEGAWL